jgi:putative exporter of polyketide antibiotics
MAEEEGKKRGKKGLFAALLAAVAGVVLFMKRKRRDGEESGWEEARPTG